MAFNRELSQFASFVEVGISSVGITTSIGIGTTAPTSRLHIVGDGLFTGIITASGFSGGPLSGTNGNFSSLYVSGVTTSVGGFTGNLNSTGVSTVGSLNIGATQVISSARQLQNIASLDATTTATIESAIANAPNTFSDLQVTGISTLGVTTTTRLTAQSINSSGIVTASTFSGNLQNTLTLNTSGTGITGSTTFNNSGNSTFTVTSNATSDNTNSTIVSRNGSGGFSAGIITATTFNGNLQNTLTLNTSGSGISGSTTYNNSGAATFTVTSNATNANTGSTIVFRDASGNFSAGVISANLTGNLNSSGVNTATTLSGTTLTYTTGNLTTGNIVTGIVTNISGTNLNYTGISTITNVRSTTLNNTGVGTITTLNSTTGTITTLSGTSLNYTNVSVGVVTSTTIDFGTNAEQTTTSTGITTTTATAIDSFAVTTFRSARIQVQITQGTNYQASDILLIHNGTTASIIEYGSLATGEYLGNFSSDISGGNARLLVSMTSATSSTVKVLSQRITI